MQALWNRIREITITKKLRLLAGTVLEIISTGGSVAGTVDSGEIVRRCDDKSRFVPVTAATLAITVAAHGSRTIVLGAATGTACTLPPATGSGAEIDFLVNVNTAGGSQVIKVANNTDYMIGTIYNLSDDGAGGPVKGFTAANTGTVATESDTITLNGSTQGGYRGDFYRVRDAAANVWQVVGWGHATGAEATPFSAAV